MSEMEEVEAAFTHWANSVQGGSPPTAVYMGRERLYRLMSEVRGATRMTFVPEPHDLHVSTASSSPVQHSRLHLDGLPVYVVDDPEHLRVV